MKVLLLSADGAKKTLKKTFDLYKEDLKDLPRSLTPGEWCLFLNEKKNIHYIGFVNSLAQRPAPCIRIIEKVTYPFSYEEDVNNYIISLLENSIKRRMLFRDYEFNSRLVYGGSDKLPGLVVDSYENSIFIQINTAGLDQYRKTIQLFFEELCKEKGLDKKIIFLDNERYRSQEMLPLFPKEEIKEDISIVENDLKYRVSKESFQKVGYYYDHRENRKRAAELLRRLDGNYQSGLDLFCYVGSWGMNLLSSTCKSMDFVDQGDFAEDIKANLKLNNFPENGEFYRENVFDFLKKSIIEKREYDVINSDPPAFCKSKRDKHRAYDGYVKLHRNCIKVLRPGGVLLAGSCTQYINHTEFQKSVQDAALLESKSIQLVDIGVQGYDHPIDHSESKSSYLKYYAYIVE